MRRFNLSLGLSMAALAAITAAPLGNFFMPHSAYRNRVAKGRRRRRRGFVYPHSSTRQQARYARQLAAGQLQMEGIAR